MNNEQLQAKLSAAEQEAIEESEHFKAGRIAELKSEVAALRLAKEAAERERDAERARLREVRKAVASLMPPIPARHHNRDYVGIYGNGYRLAQAEALAAIDRIAGSDVSPEQDKEKTA